MMRVLIHPLRMSVRIPDVLGGLIVCGRRGGIRDSGNGDCILVDGVTGLTAVADGSDRTPGASRRFLIRLMDCLHGKGIRRDGYRLEELLTAARDVLGEFVHGDRTTFVCLLPSKDGTMLYISGGDSLLLHVDARSGQVLFRNQANMGFAGRCREVIDFGRLDARDGEFVLMATDGFWDLAGREKNDLKQAFLESIGTDPVDSVADSLVRAFHPAFRDEPVVDSYDDLGVLLIDPVLLSRVRFRSRVLLGGTSPETEARYRRLCSRETFPARYVALPDCETDSPWILPDCLHPSLVKAGGLVAFDWCRE